MKKLNETIMRLSNLQKYILKTTLQNNKIRVSKNIFKKFYNNTKKCPAKKLKTNIITKSIERLIDKGLLIGYGEKTQYKLFITKIKLTSKGKKSAQELFGKQVKLPLKLNNNTKKTAL